MCMLCFVLINSVLLNHLCVSTQLNKVSPRYYIFHSDSLPVSVVPRLQVYQPCDTHPVTEKMMAMQTMKDVIIILQVQYDETVSRFNILMNCINHHYK